MDIGYWATMLLTASVVASVCYVVYMWVSVLLGKTKNGPDRSLSLLQHHAAR